MLGAQFVSDKRPARLGESLSAGSRYRPWICAIVCRVRQLPDEIAAPVLNWLDEKVPTPAGPPCVNATVKLKAVHEHLIGSMRGSDGPTSGTRTYSMDVKFYAVPETEQAAIGQLLAGLRWAAGEEPRIDGLPEGGLLRLGEERIEAKSEHGDPDHDGPIITLAAVAQVPE